jgi:hypothetical protein
MKMLRQPGVPVVFGVSAGRIPQLDEQIGGNVEIVTGQGFELFLDVFGFR